MYLEPPYDSERGWQIAMAAGALALLSAALYYANYSLSDVTIDIVWSESRDLDRDSRLRLIRNNAGLFCAALPWAGVWLGVSNAGVAATRNNEQINEARGMLGWEIEAANLAEILNGLQWTLLIVALCGLVVVRFPTRFSQKRMAALVGIRSIALLFLVGAFVPGLMGDPRNMEAVVWMFRAIGPLGMIILDVLLLVCLRGRADRVGTRGRASRGHVGGRDRGCGRLLPLEAGGIALLVTLSFLTVAVLALLSRRWELLWFSSALVLLSVGFCGVRYPDKIELASFPEGRDLVTAYNDWLKERESLRDEYKKARAAAIRYSSLPRKVAAFMRRRPHQHFFRACRSAARALPSTYSRSAACPEALSARQCFTASFGTKS